MRNLLLLSLALLIFTPAWGARSFNGSSDGIKVGCTGTQGTCNTVCVTCTIVPMVSTAAASWSISFWLWENSWGTGDALILEQSANFNNESGAFMIDSGGVPSGSPTCTSAVPYFSVQTSTGTHYRSRSFTHPSSGAWHHYLFTLDQAGSSWGLYIDGASQSLVNCDITAGSHAGVLDGVSLMSRNNASLFNAGKMARLAIWHDVILSADEAKSLASCVEPWLIQPEKLSIYVPLYGHDSPEPSYAVSQGLRNLGTLTGTSLANDPPICNGVD